MSKHETVQELVQAGLSPDQAFEWIHQEEEYLLQIACGSFSLRPGSVRLQACGYSDLRTSPQKPKAVPRMPLVNRFESVVFFFMKKQVDDSKLSATSKTALREKTTRHAI